LFKESHYDGKGFTQALRSLGSDVPFFALADVPPDSVEATKFNKLEDPGDYWLVSSIRRGDTHG